ncbi:anti-sigma factor domain-containing protein [Microbacterium sp. DT81.1]|uniref:anti-sigma factor n=1 Tax=Microbacterium sp. DT81.1 TaxID=3393413 RepID=UPI003CF1E5C5
MNQREFAELAAGHALGALSADDERSFEAALVAHPEWAAVAESDLAVVARLADMVDEVPPPQAVKTALFARLDAAPDGVGGAGAVGATRAAAGTGAADVTGSADVMGASDVADALPPAHAADSATAARPDVGARPDASSRRATRETPRRGGRAARTWFALAASIALLLGVGVGVTSLVQSLTRPASVVALERIEDAPDAQTAEAQIEGGGEATLHWSPSLGEAVLVSDGLPTLAGDQTFELWYVRGDTAISAGTFDASSASTTAVLEPGIQPGDAVAMTVEPAGGSPTGAPTTDPIVVISTA